MGRSPCCDETGLKKGPWTPEEDQKLVNHIQKHGHGSWRALPKLAGLNRCGKSCRLRWTNYLRPDIKRGKFSPEEEQTILNLHAILGNKWSAIATHLPGRTDNEIKNFWNTHLKKKLIQMGFDPMTHRPRTDIFSSLPHLLALANLKELIQMDSMNSSSWEEQAVRLQTEVAKLQYLQLLLQPPNNNNPTPIPGLDMGPIPGLPGLDGPSPFNLDRLPDLRTLEAGPMGPELMTTSKVFSGNDDQMGSIVGYNNNNQQQVAAAACEFSTSPTSPPWLPSLSSSPSPPAATAGATHAPPVDGGAGSSCTNGTAGSFWPDLLLEDSSSLFHDIA